MDSIELLMQEHSHVLRLASVIKSACCGLIEGAPVEEADFRQMIIIAREYADKYHHGKEEKILFVEMIEHLGHVAENLIRHGMLVEHDQGRFFLMNLEDALAKYAEEPTTENRLDIILNAGSWADLLVRHADKEDAVVYSFAKRALNDEILAKIHAEIEQFQQEHAAEAEPLLAELDRLEQKYLRS